MSIPRYYSAFDTSDQADVQQIEPEIEEQIDYDEYETKVNKEEEADAVKQQKKPKSLKKSDNPNKPQIEEVVSKEEAQNVYTPILPDEVITYRSNIPEQMPKQNMEQEKVRESIPKALPKLRLLLKDRLVENVGNVSVTSLLSHNLIAYTKGKKAYSMWDMPKLGTAQRKGMVSLVKHQISDPLIQANFPYLENHTDGKYKRARLGKNRAKPQLEKLRKIGLKFPKSPVLLPPPRWIGKKEVGVHEDKSDALKTLYSLSSYNTVVEIPDFELKDEYVLPDYQPFYQRYNANIPFFSFIRILAAQAQAEYQYFHPDTKVTTLQEKALTYKKVFDDLKVTSETNAFGTSGIQGQIGRLDAACMNVMNYVENSGLFVAKDRKRWNSYFKLTELSRPFQSITLPDFIFDQAYLHHCDNFIRTLQLLYSRSRRARVFRQTMRSEFERTKQSEIRYLDLVLKPSDIPSEDHTFPIFSAPADTNSGFFFNKKHGFINLKPDLPEEYWALGNFRASSNYVSELTTLQFFIRDLVRAIDPHVPKQFRKDLLEVLRNWSFIALAKTVPKVEVYKITKWEVKERNIYSVNTFFYELYLAITKMMTYHQPRAWEENSTNKCLEYFSCADNVIGKLMNKCMRQAKLTPFIIDYLVYSDNIYFYYFDDIREQFVWISCDGSTMESCINYPIALFAMAKQINVLFPGAIDFEKFLSGILQLRKEKRRGGKGNNATPVPVSEFLSKIVKKSFFKKKAKNIPYFLIGYFLLTAYNATHTIGVLGASQFLVPGMASGVGPTFQLNTALMDLVAAILKHDFVDIIASRPPTKEESGKEWYKTNVFRNRKGSSPFGINLLESASKDAVRKEFDFIVNFFKHKGVNLKVEAVEIIKSSERTPRILELDLLGFDAYHIPLLKDYFIPVLAKDRLDKALAFSKVFEKDWLALIHKELKDTTAASNLYRFIESSKAQSLFIMGGFCRHAYREVLTEYVAMNYVSLGSAVKDEEFKDVVFDQIRLSLSATTVVPLTRSMIDSFIDHGRVISPRDCLYILLGDDYDDFKTRYNEWRNEMLLRVEKNNNDPIIQADFYKDLVVVSIDSEVMDDDDTRITTAPRGDTFKTGKLDKTEIEFFDEGPEEYEQFDRVQANPKLQRTIQRSLPQTHRKYEPIGGKSDISGYFYDKKKAKLEPALTNKQKDKLRSDILAYLNRQDFSEGQPKQKRLVIQVSPKEYERLHTKKTSTDTIQKMLFKAMARILNTKFQGHRVKPIISTMLKAYLKAASVKLRTSMFNIKKNVA